MKHLLNNLTEEEKNAIREQHTGGMKVMNENFHNLLNSKLGDVKPLQIISEEIIYPDKSDKFSYDKNKPFEKIINDTTILIVNGNSETVKDALSQITNSTELVGLINCEYADFSDINICNRPKLIMIKLTGTKNNFEEFNWECIDVESSSPEEGLFFITDQYSLF